MQRKEQIRICPKFISEEETCELGDKCKLSHDLLAYVEYQRKNGACRTLAKTNKCSYGQTCKFTHDPLIIA